MKQGRLRIAGKQPNCPRRRDCEGAAPFGRSPHRSDKLDGGCMLDMRSVLPGMTG